MTNRDDRPVLAECSRSRPWSFGATRDIAASLKKSFKLRRPPLGTGSPPEEDGDGQQSCKGNSFEPCLAQPAIDRRLRRACLPGPVGNPDIATPEAHTEVSDLFRAFRVQGVPAPIEMCPLLFVSGDHPILVLVAVREPFVLIDESPCVTGHDFDVMLIGGADSVRQVRGIKTRDDKNRCREDQSEPRDRHAKGLQQACQDRRSVALNLPSLCHLVSAYAQRAKLLPQAIAGWFELDEVRMKSCSASDLFW